MRAAADILFDIILRCRAIALRRLLLLTPEIFFDGVPHGQRFLRRFGFVFDPEPCLAGGSIAHKLHLTPLTPTPPAFRRASMCRRAARISSPATTGTARR